jgi:hypothetical protein
MKTCPTCNRSYTDASLNFCLEDGTPLVNAPASGFDPNATIRYTEPRNTKPPPEPSVVPPPPPASQPGSFPNQGSFPARPQWSQPPVPAPRKKSNTVWWILGGLLVLAVIGVGAVIMIIALASMGSNSNANSNRANTNRVTNRNANVNTNTPNSNANADLPSSLTDNFSEQKWGTGSFDFGDLWYADDQYHMRSKEGKYLVMYAPTNDYRTGNATVRVTARSVDGTAPASGFGLIVHGERSKDTQQLEDYALLILIGSTPKYEIIKHKGGKQTEVVPWTDSDTIRTGSNTNQLEVRARGTDLSFYINGQYVDRIKDTENFKGGLAGFYTSGNTEVAFDDLEIER